MVRTTVFLPFEGGSGDVFPSMCKSIARSGWRVVASEADVTEADSGSAGVMVLARSYLGLSNLAVYGPSWQECSSSRFLVCTLRLRKVNLTIVPLYLHTGIGLTGANVRLLSQVGSTVSQAGVPVFVVGDWQCSPTVVGESNFFGKAGLQMVPMPGVKVT